MALPITALKLTGHDGCEATLHYFFPTDCSCGGVPQPTEAVFSAAEVASKMFAMAVNAKQLLSHPSRTLTNAGVTEDCQLMAAVAWPEGGPATRQPVVTYDQLLTWMINSIRRGMKTQFDHDKQRVLELVQHSALRAESCPERFAQLLLGGSFGPPARALKQLVAVLGEVTHEALRRTLLTTLDLPGGGGQSKALHDKAASVLLSTHGSKEERELNRRSDLVADLLLALSDPKTGGSTPALPALPDAEAAAAAQLPPPASPDELALWTHLVLRRWPVLCRVLENEAVAARIKTMELAARRDALRTAATDATLLLKLTLNISDERLDGVVRRALAPVGRALGLQADESLSVNADQTRRAYDQLKGRLHLLPPLTEAATVSARFDGVKLLERRRARPLWKLLLPSLATSPEFPLGVFLWTATFDAVKTAKRTHHTPLIIRSASVPLLAGSVVMAWLLTYIESNDKPDDAPTLSTHFDASVKFLHVLADTMTPDPHGPTLLPNQVWVALDGAALITALNTSSYTSNYPAYWSTAQKDTLRDVSVFAPFSITLALQEKVESLQADRSPEDRRSKATAEYGGICGVNLFRMDTFHYLRASLHLLLAPVGKVSSPPRVEPRPPSPSAPRLRSSPALLVRSAPADVGLDVRRARQARRARRLCRAPEEDLQALVRELHPARDGPGDCHQHVRRGQNDAEAMARALSPRRRWRSLWAGGLRPRRRPAEHRTLLGLPRSRHSSLPRPEL